MMGNTFNTVNFLTKALDGSWKRHEAITNNIANVNTPGYKRINVKFEEQLEKAINKNNFNMSTTDERHYDTKNPSVSEIEPVIEKDESTSARRDGNNVNIDVENANMAKNTLYYNSLIKQVSGELSKIKTVINRGNR
ncbi:flagellar basal body rod protein FlgB [Dethiothermospora halolimnae]|uniref:flagellar basal body rod protein FlgB n=1 Tax=Dethiothermospora halolimnae TaxID=3114390 RepID=UPI003CCBFC3A